MTKQRESGIKMVWSILAPFLIYYIVHDSARLLLAFLQMLMIQGTFGKAIGDMAVYQEPTVSGVMNALSLLIGMAAVLPMAKQEFHRKKSVEQEKEDAGESSRKPQGKEYLLLAVFAASLAMGMNILLSLIGVTAVSQTYQNITTQQFGVIFGAGILLYGVLAPFAEEVVFRGVIYNRMKRCMGTMPAVILCGVLFGVYHGNLVQGIYGCVMGIGITYMYEKYGSFLAPVLFHSVANVSVFIAGYNQEVMTAVLTPVNCVIFMIISVASLCFIGKMRKNI